MCSAFYYFHRARLSGGAVNYEKESPRLLAIVCLFIACKAEETTIRLATLVTAMHNLDSTHKRLLEPDDPVTYIPESIVVSSD